MGEGENGFLVDSVEQAANRIVRLLRDPISASRMDERAKEDVKQKFLTTRLMEDWLDLIGSFETHFRLKGSP